jgi:hypothetical protein
MKTKRMSLMVRTWKNFRAYAKEQKLLKASTVCILQEERLRNESYYKAVFDSLRLNKENEKHLKTF